MISQITGMVVAVSDHSLTLQLLEFCYEILVPGSVINAYAKKSGNGKPSSEEKDTFFTIQYIEGASGHGNQYIRLVGFKREIEREFFQLYTSVEGIGYRTALKSLILPIQKIALAIEGNDLITLKKLPHIGTRTAEKMVATLRGRMKKFALDRSDSPLTAVPESDLAMEVRQVLRQVGYGEQEASALIEKAMAANPHVKDAEEMIQQIFQMQSKLK